MQEAVVKQRSPSPTDSKNARRRGRERAEDNDGRANRLDSAASVNKLLDSGKAATRLDTLRKDAVEQRALDAEILLEPVRLRA
jgi:hypothetical protein